MADPLPILREDVFSSIFHLLPTTSALSATRVNRHWKETLESTPLLFQTADFTEVVEIDRESQTLESTRIVRLRETNQTISALSRLSDLSQNRLQEFALSLEYFWFELRLQELPWEKTKLSKLFNILSLSSHTLKQVYLCAPSEDLRSSRLDPDHRDSARQVLSLIKALKSFPSLELVSIRAKIWLNVTSYDGKKTIQITNDVEKIGEEDEASENSVYLELLRTMGTGKIVAFWTQGLTDLDPEIFQEIRESKDCLEGIHLDTRTAVGHDQCWRDFAFTCSNLKSFSLTSAFDQDNQERIVSFGKGNQSPKNLKVLNLQQVGTSIKWDSNFIKWVGNHLEKIVIHYHKDCFEDYHKENLRLSSIDVNDNGKFVPPLSQLVSILTNSSSTLKSLSLDEPRFYHLSQPLVEATQDIELPNVTHLEVRGPSKLINFFLSKVKYSSLESVELLAKDEEGFESPKINLVELLVTLESCRETLEFFHIFHLKANWLLNLKPEEPVDKEKIPKSLRKIHFPRLKSIAMPRLDRSVIETLMEIFECPNLEYTKLPKDPSEIQASALKKYGLEGLQEKAGSLRNGVKEKVEQAKEREDCIVM